LGFSHMHFEPIDNRVRRVSERYGARWENFPLLKNFGSWIIGAGMYKIDIQKALEKMQAKGAPNA
ncbi:MAG: hypothetical protein V1708_04110, partial [Candidatus Micrarchaeota archaeon]